MEAVIIFLTLEILKACNLEAFLISHRISVRSKNNTYRCFIFKFQLQCVQFSIHTCFHNINDIILHSWKNHLSLRVTETGIVFKNLRSVRCQHETEEDNTCKWSSLRSHGIHRRLIDIFFTELIHFPGIERTWREITHTSGIQTLVTVFGALMVLCRIHNLNGFSVNEAENRYFPSRHELFDNHGVPGSAEFLVFHDFLHACFGFFQSIAN